MTIRLLSLPVVLSLAGLGLVGCASNNDRPAAAPAAELPMPSGKGTTRAMLVVEGDAPEATKKRSTAQDTELSSERILRKVLATDRP